MNTRAPLKTLGTALAIAATGGAWGQSSVTLFGTVDLNVTYAKAGGRSATSMDQGGNLVPSRLGVRGTEDIGGGMSVGFWLESAILPQTGAVQGAMWHRRSTLSVAHARYGELRLGRDYTPTFWNLSQFTPFGTVGVAGSSNIIEGWPFGLGETKTLARANDSIGYFLPRGLGGVYGQAMMTLGNDAEGTRYRGGRIGYESGPFNIAAAYGVTNTVAGHSKVATIGASYDLKLAKLSANYFQQRLGSARHHNTMVGMAMPAGKGIIKASYAQSRLTGAGVTASDARQLGVGYVHQLSKRTALYTTYSHITNKGGASYVTADTSPEGAPGTASSGFQVGISHSF